MVTLKFKNAYINDWFSVAGPDEAKGNIRNADMYLKDFYYGKNTFEEAETQMQKSVIKNLSRNNQYDLIIGGDLSNQLGNMNLAMRDFKISFLGVYNACASFIESMIIASSLVDTQLNNILCLTSSHALTSERQFRFPCEYGSLKSCYTTNTITCSIGATITNKKTNYKIISGTIGNVVDYKIKDVANMGAVMAPSAASVINEHMKNTNSSIDDYDYILTGDLGTVGINLLSKILDSVYNIKSKKIADAGSLIYKKDQNKGSGGSGPTCLPFVFFNKLIKDKKTKRVLLVGTGALHNTTLVNQKNSIPGIAHAIEIEVNHVN